jgi:hypothetical protein
MNKLRLLSVRVITALCFIGPPVGAWSETGVRDRLGAAIERESQAVSPAYSLEVYCAGDHGIRALTVFQGGVGIWDGERQLELPPELRREQLRALLHAGFAEFDALYGGKSKPEKAEAPLRVSCRIALQIGELQQRSAQAVDGEQHAPLLELADALLDLAEPLVPAGLSAENLDHALSLLAEERLAPEVLSLRLLRLPMGGSGKPGQIIRIKGGEGSRQSYAPGLALGSPLQVSLMPETVARIARAAHESGFATWPINLPGEGITELQISVLGHDRTVTARAYSRAGTDDLSATGRAFAGLVDQLMSLVGSPDGTTDTGGR